MPSKTYTSTQGEAWDQIAKRCWGQEGLMGVLPPQNVQELDALFLSGDLTVTLPDDVEPKRTVYLPPWETM